MTKTWCEDTAWGTYVGGSKCFGGVCQGGTIGRTSRASVEDECPGGVVPGRRARIGAAEHRARSASSEGLGNCQRSTMTEETPRDSAISLCRAAARTWLTISSRSATRSPSFAFGVPTRNPEGTARPSWWLVDCAETLHRTTFRIRVYASDEFGLAGHEPHHRGGQPTAGERLSSGPHSQHLLGEVAQMVPVRSVGLPDRSWR